VSGAGKVSRRGFVRSAAALAGAAPALMAAEAEASRPWHVPEQVRPADVPLYDLEVWQAADLIRRRVLSPVELAKAVIERNDKVEPIIGTYANRYPSSEVMAQAQVAEDEIGRGRYRGPLHGIPVGLKDIYLTQGKVTEGNSKLYTGFVPTFDGTAVIRLKEAGAVLMGKAGTSELATANGWPAKNPWDFERQAGGSSTGSATGVAASQFMVGMGTCTGGSIRGPAANCGVTGFKPTYGTISAWGVFPLAWSMDHPGPLAHSARDVALVMDIVAGEDPKDPNTRKVARYRMAEALVWGMRSNALEGVTIGIPADDDFFMGVPSDEQIAAYAEAKRALSSLGATLKTVRTKMLLPGMTSTSSFYDIIRSAEVGAYQHHNLRTQPQNMSDGYRSRVSAGVLMPGNAYMQAQRVRRMWRDQLLAVFNEVDVMIHPADDIAGKQGEDRPWTRRSSGGKTNMWNLTGAPAVALPTGFSRAEKMPLSMQVVSRPGRDETVLMVADAYQQVTDHHKKRPPLTT
jgi:aspartyl-tRNA(Asn)/glutamyl-tRNA(Gln) amidotransferase subunit A